MELGFRNALAGALRSNILTLDHAVEIVEKAEQQLAGREFLLLARAVLELVANSNCSAYDCEFVALGGNMECGW